MPGPRNSRKDFSAMTNLFGLRSARPASARKVAPPRYFRPRLESMEARDVPAALPALIGSPLVNSVNLTGITGDVLQLVANVTTPGGQALQVPLTLENIAP